MIPCKCDDNLSTRLSMNSELKSIRRKMNETNYVEHTNRNSPCDDFYKYTFSFSKIITENTRYKVKGNSIVKVKHKVSFYFCKKCEILINCESTKTRHIKGFDALNDELLEFSHSEKLMS